MERTVDSCNYSNAKNVCFFGLTEEGHLDKVSQAARGLRQRSRVTLQKKGFFEQENRVLNHRLSDWDKNLLLTGAAAKPSSSSFEANTPRKTVQKHRQNIAEYAQNMANISLNFSQNLVPVCFTAPSTAAAPCRGSKKFFSLSKVFFFPDRARPPCWAP